MKLLGFLKDKVDKAETMEAKKGIIAEAGMELTDDELEIIAGGRRNTKPMTKEEFTSKSREQSRKNFQQQHQADKEENKKRQQWNRLLR